MCKNPIPNYCSFLGHSSWYVQSALNQRSKKTDVESALRERFTWRGGKKKFLSSFATVTVYFKCQGLSFYPDCQKIIGYGREMSEKSENICEETGKATRLQKYFTMDYIVLFFLS